MEGTRAAHRVAKVATAPVRFVSHIIGRWYHHDERHGKIVIGVVFIVVGSTIATNYPEGCHVPHCLWDAFAYLLHGFGSMPILERVFAATLAD